MTNELQTIIGNNKEVCLFNEPSLRMYTSMPTKTLAQKAKVFNLMDTEESLSDHLGEVFNTVHVIAHIVTLEDDQTGEPNDTARIVLVTDEGKAYYAISDGVHSSLTNIFDIAGRPETWTESIPLIPVETKTRKGYKVLKLRFGVIEETTTADKPKK